MADLLSALVQLPEEWAIVPVGPNKNAYLPGWNKRRITREDTAKEIGAGRAVALGLCAGPLSNGIAMVDFDGFTSVDALATIGITLADFPKTVAWTSGREGRHQRAYRVPEEFWSAITSRQFRTKEPAGPDDKGEQLELRWAGLQSVIIGHHPTTGGYRWCEGCSPWDVEVADCPLPLIEAMLKEPEPLPPPPPRAVVPAAFAEDIPLEALLTREHAQQFRDGVGEGSRDNAAAAIIRDLLGAEAYCQQHGVRYYGDPHALLADFAARCTPPLPKRDVDRIVRSAQRSNPTPAYGIDKRVEYHQRPQQQQRPWQAPQQPTGRPTFTVVTGGALPAEDAAPEPSERLLEPYEPSLATAARYSAIRGLDAKTFSMMLRSTYGDRLRFNRLTTQPELDGAPLPYRLDYLYVNLAQNNWKLGKDTAIDVLLAVAQENTFCPVREYLEHVAATVPPMDITRLASQLLRPEDAALPEPTIYDRMMEVNLIGAVRRVFEPGCQHDSGVILYSAEQGKRKTTFWEALAAGFFNGDFKDHTNKDDLMKMHRAWIVEWGEIDQVTSKRDVSEVKHFMTIKEDFVRVPYGKDVEKYPRRSILVGSTNREDFMTDDTGNRRFHVIPITVDQIPVEHVAQARDAIWAGVLAAYRGGAANHLTRVEEDLVNQLNLGHLQQSDWHPIISRWLDGEGNLDLAHGTLTIAQVLTGAIQKPAGQWTRRDRDEVARVLRQMGLDCRRARIGGTLQYVWRRP